MKYNSIKTVERSDFVNMGPIELRQPFPSKKIEGIDPFVLLHHYGPYEISPESNPFDLGPHPHRGFEPVTFLVEGEQLHRDSLGNESVVKAGDVQWTTAGRGIIHAEGPSKSFVESGGIIEGIQLWLNLPAEKKMIPANYQHGKAEEFPALMFDGDKVSVKVIAGQLEDAVGTIQTQTAVNAFMIDMKANSNIELPYAQSHQGLIYLLKGSVEVNNNIPLQLDHDQLIQFNQDGEGIHLRSNLESKLLFLSGEPLNEKVTAWGPYVMNTQTEIMEAMRDYQMGKMGFLPVS
ncbi:MAG: pirin family protein [Bacteroidota bacterium]